MVLYCKHHVLYLLSLMYVMSTYNLIPRHRGPHAVVCTWHASRLWDTSHPIRRDTGRRPSWYTWTGMWGRWRYLISSISITLLLSLISHRLLYFASYISFLSLQHGETPNVPSPYTPAQTYDPSRYCTYERRYGYKSMKVTQGWLSIELLLFFEITRC